MELGWIAPNLASLSSVSFPNMLECAYFFGNVRGHVCCDNHHIIICMFGGCVGRRVGRGGYELGR